MQQCMNMRADNCTAAISEDGALYTWGDGSAGNLGYGDTVRQSIPRRVEARLLEHFIVQACFSLSVCALHAPE
jgi:alpha-tubulin suppressor-like RCC1 family protein